MSCNTIETPSIVIETISTEVNPALPETITEPSYEVEVNPLQYTLSNDNIFLVEQSGDIPEWLEDMIDTAINTSPVSTDLDDLIRYLSQLEDGYTNRINYVENEQGKQLSKIEAIKLSNDELAAAVVDLDIVKVSPTRATAISRDTVAAWSQDGSGGAWFDERIRADRTNIMANASVISSLVATTTSQGSSIGSALFSIEELKKQNDGIIESWFYNAEDPVDENDPSQGLIGSTGPVDALGKIDPKRKPYKTWLEEGTLSLHTGDSYVLSQAGKDGGPREYIASWRFGKITEDINQIGDNDGYAWIAIVDAKSIEAFELALHTKGIADGKVLFVGGLTRPNFTDPKYNDPTTGKTYDTKDHLGDIWYDGRLMRVLQGANGCDKEADGTTDTNTSDCYDVTFIGNDTNGNTHSPKEVFTWKYMRDQEMTIRIDKIDSVTAGQFTVFGYDELSQGYSIPYSPSVRYEFDEEGNKIESLEIGMVRLVKRSTKDFEYNPDTKEIDQTESPKALATYYHANTGQAIRQYNEVWQYTSKALGNNNEHGSTGWVLQESLSIEGTYGVSSKLVVHDGGITGWTAVDGSNVNSEFIVNADIFKIKDSSNTATPFELRTFSDNSSKLTLNSDMLINGNIQSSNLSLGTQIDSCGYPKINGFGLFSDGVWRDENDNLISSYYNIVGGSFYGNEMVSGKIKSPNYEWNNGRPKGFTLESCPSEGLDSSTRKYYSGYTKTTKAEVSYNNSRGKFILTMDFYLGPSYNGNMFYIKDLDNNTSYTYNGYKNDYVIEIYSNNITVQYISSDAQNSYTGGHIEIDSTDGDGYNIIGGAIYGSYVYGSVVEGVKINGGDINGAFISGGLTALSKIVTQHKKSTYYELDAKLTEDRTLIYLSGTERGAQIKTGIFTSNYGSTQDVFRMMAPDNSQCIIKFSYGSIYDTPDPSHFVELCSLDTHHDNQDVKVQVYIGGYLLDESDYIRVDNNAPSYTKNIAGIDFKFGSSAHGVQEWYARSVSTLRIPSYFTYEGEIIFKFIARYGTHGTTNHSSSLNWHVTNIKTKMSIDGTYQD